MELAGVAHLPGAADRFLGECELKGLPGPEGGIDVAIGVG
jgi:hypothetical protein